jgi:hypothetical protein
MIETGEGNFSFWNGTFWDLWWQKIFRNFASAKYQWLFFLYIPTVYGMFTEGLTPDQPFVSAALGLGFLGGGFVTLALGRFMSNTKLKEVKASKDINIHKQNIQRGQPTSNVIMGNQFNDEADNKIEWDDPSGILDTDK